MDPNIKRIEDLSRRVGFLEGGLLAATYVQEHPGTDIVWDAIKFEKAYMERHGLERTAGGWGHKVRDWPDNPNCQNNCGCSYCLRGECNECPGWHDPVQGPPVYAKTHCYLCGVELPKPMPIIRGVKYSCEDGCPAEVYAYATPT